MAEARAESIPPAASSATPDADPVTKATQPSEREGSAAGANWQKYTAPDEEDAKRTAAAPEGVPSPDVAVATAAATAPAQTAASMDAPRQARWEPRNVEMLPIRKHRDSALSSAPTRCVLSDDLPNEVIDGVPWGSKDLRDALRRSIESHSIRKSGEFWIVVHRSGSQRNLLAQVPPLQPGRDCLLHVHFVAATRAWVASRCVRAEEGGEFGRASYGRSDEAAMPVIVGFEVGGK